MDVVDRVDCVDRGWNGWTGWTVVDCVELGGPWFGRDGVNVVNRGGRCGG